MRLAASLLAVILLTASVQAADWRDNTYPDTVVISSLPYTCSANNTVYLLNANLNSSGDGITVYNRNYIKIDGRGRTITFDTDGGGNANGLKIEGSSHHVVVTDLTVTQARTTGLYGSPGGSNCNAMLLDQCSYVYFRDCNAHVTGHSSMSVEGSQGTKQIVEFDGGNFTSYSRSFDSRHMSDGATFKLASPKSSPDSTFHFYVHGITIDSACHAGLLVGGIAWVDSNYVMIDTYNQKPNTSWANAHGIADLGNAWAGSHFRYNVIRTGTRHYGGRGMYFNFAAGNANAPIEVAYNDVQVTSGYTTEYDAARGLRVRWGCQYLRVHNNRFHVVADDDPNTAHISNEAHGIWFGADPEEGSDIGANNWFYNNEIHAYYYSTNGARTGQATCFIADQQRDPNQPFGNNNKSFNNHFYSNFRCIQICDDGHPGSEWVSINDTLEWLAPKHTDTWGFTGVVGVGAGPVTALNNWLIDPVFVNASYNDVTNRSGGGMKSIYVGRTVQVNVSGSRNDAPIGGATVRIFNRYGNVGNLSSAVTTRNTNNRGEMLDTLAYRYQRWDGSTLSYDSTFNNYTIRVTALGLTKDTVVALSDLQAGQAAGAVVLSIALDTLGQEISNNAPSAPVVYSPTNGATVVTTQPALIVNNGSDSDGDALTYQFEVYDAAGTTLLYSQSNIAQSPTRTSWTVSTALVAGTSYRWRARCYDGIATSAWTAMSSFTVSGGQDNIAPAAPVMHSPTIGAVINIARPTLSVFNATDADNDLLTYSFELYDSAGATLVASASAVAQGSSYTTWTVPNDLENLTAYSWRSRAHDGEAYSPWMASGSFRVDLSVAVSLPVHSSPVNNSAVIGEPIVLIVDNATHAEELTVAYDFYIYTDQSLSSVAEEVLGVAETPGKTSASLSLAPVDGQTYWWRVRARSANDSTALTSATSFTYYTFGASEETVPLAAYPPNGEIVELRQPVFRARNIEAPGNHTYTFQVASDPSFQTIVDASGAVAQGENDETTWSGNSELHEGVTYYWHVRADNYPFSQTQSFQVGAKVIAFPNPVRFREGELVTFQLPEEPVDLMIQTISGETVVIQNDVSGTWQWDGRNGSGKEIAVGTYLWYVSDGKQNGKIVVLP